MAKIGPVAWPGSLSEETGIPGTQQWPQNHWAMRGAPHMRLSQGAGPVGGGPRAL